MQCRSYRSGYPHKKRTVISTSITRLDPVARLNQAPPPHSNANAASAAAVYRLWPNFDKIGSNMYLTIKPYNPNVNRQRGKIPGAAVASAICPGACKAGIFITHLPPSFAEKRLSMDSKASETLSALSRCARQVRPFAGFRKPTM